MGFDELILSCPLDKKNLSQFLQLSNRELFLLDQIIYNPYSVTTYEIKQLQGLHLPKPVTYILPTPPKGSPMAIIKNVPGGKLASFYTTTVDEAGQEIPKDRIIQEIHRYVEKLGAAVEGEPYTYNNWRYFPHVSSEVMQAGFYDQLEKLQGVQNTYYTGGVMNFETVETVVEYSKTLVDKYFPTVK